MPLISVLTISSLQYSSSAKVSGFDTVKFVYATLACTHNIIRYITKDTALPEMIFFASEYSRGQPL